MKCLNEALPPYRTHRFSKSSKAFKCVCTHGLCARQLERPVHELVVFNVLLGGARRLREEAFELVAGILNTKKGNIIFVFKTGVK